MQESDPESYQMTEKPILFIWDFHGVLEKDNELAVQEATNAVLEEYGYDVRASFEDIMRLYGLKWQDYFRHLIPGIDDPTVEEMVDRCRQLGRPAAARHCKPRDNALETLSTIQEAGHTNIVVSNTRQRDLEFFMDLVGITAFIESAHGIGDLTRWRKTEVIKEYARSHDYGRLVVIGDTEKDVEAGLNSGATTYLFNSLGENRNTKAHNTIHDLREVLRDLHP